MGFSVRSSQDFLPSSTLFLQMWSKRQNSRVTSRWVYTRFLPMLFQSIDCVFLALMLHPWRHRQLLQGNRNSRLLFGHLCRLKHIFKPLFKGPLHCSRNGLHKLAQASAITHFLVGSASEASPSTALVSQSMIALLVCGPPAPPQSLPLPPPCTNTQENQTANMFSKAIRTRRKSGG